MQVMGFIVSMARLSGVQGTRKGEESLFRTFFLMAVFKRHSFSDGVTSNILRLHIQNSSNHLVPRRVTTIAQAKISVKLL